MGIAVCSFPIAVVIRICACLPLSLPAWCLLILFGVNEAMSLSMKRVRALRDSPCLLAAPPQCWMGRWRHDNPAEFFSGRKRAPLALFLFI
jgi:hypothetical protein